MPEVSYLLRQQEEKVERTSKEQEAYKLNDGLCYKTCLAKNGFRVNVQNIHECADPASDAGINETDVIEKALNVLV